MRSGIIDRKIDKNGNALASHFLKFLCQPTFGTFAKSHKSTHNLNFAKEPNLASASVKSILQGQIGITMIDKISLSERDNYKEEVL
jgi:aminopeptidase-like protein